MKNVLILFATITFLCGFQTSLSAQKTATWTGGTPGRPFEWNCAANWKEGRVPNEFSRVIIPDVSTSTFSYPALSGGEVEIWSLQILSGARLKIGRNARLIVTEQDSREFAADSVILIRPGRYEGSLVLESK